MRKWYFRVFFFYYYFLVLLFPQRCSFPQMWGVWTSPGLQTWVTSKDILPSNFLAFMARPSSPSAAFASCEWEWSRFPSSKNSAPMTAWQYVTQVNEYIYLSFKIRCRTFRFSCFLSTWHLSMFCCKLFFWLLLWDNKNMNMSRKSKLNVSVINKWNFDGRCVLALA